MEREQRPLTSFASIDFAQVRVVWDCAIVPSASQSQR